MKKMIKKILALFKRAETPAPKPEPVVLKPVYFIAVDGGNAPKAGHDDYNDAVEEAVRLSIKTGKAARIFIQLAFVRPSGKRVYVTNFMKQHSRLVFDHDRQQIEGPLNIDLNFTTDNPVARHG